MTKPSQSSAFEKIPPIKDAYHAIEIASALRKEVEQGISLPSWVRENDDKGAFVRYIRKELSFFLNKRQEETPSHTFKKPL